jgi:hypothetical protein
MIRTARRATIQPALSKLVLVVSLLLPAIARGQAVRVSGVTFDSLTGLPIRGAFITLGSRSTLSDSLGRFEFDSVAPGTYRATMQHDQLDSLGLGGITTTVVVSENMAPVRIATPSIMTMWSRVCPGRAPQDSGFVFGTVLDAATKTPVRGAPIIATWIDLRSEGRTVGGKEWRLESTTADDGSFVLCGVPRGNGGGRHSHRGSVVAPSQDMVLSMTSPVRRQDLALPDPAAAARGVVRGRVVSDAKPVPNARVVVGSSPEVRTADDGQFIVRSVPAGTQQIEVQGIGFTAVTKILNVGGNDTVDVELDVQRVVRLDSVVVRASAAREQLKRDFDDRRRRGSGYFRDSTQIGKYLRIEGVFATMASVRTERSYGGGLSVVIGGSRARGIRRIEGCTAVVIVDRVRTDFEHLNALQPQDIAAMEVYRTNEMPMDLATQFGFNPFNRPCAVVAWTKAGWR